MPVIFDLKTDINDVLREFGLPRYRLLLEIKSITDMVNRIINSYYKEVQIQSIWGGIRNPAGVIQNKIRHELTNYDEVRDALTDALEDGMDKSLVMDIREELANMSYQMTSCIINALPIIEIKDNNKAIKINKQQLHKANEGYLLRESKHIRNEKIFS